MNYNTLITKPLYFWNKKTITEDIIIDALESCYKECAFSTFPYIMEKSSSAKAIKKYKSGNCIALSMYIKKYLKKHHNIKSILIPATIPNKYKSTGYLDISHVALAIPFISGDVFIVDPSFYFLNPIKFNVHTPSTFNIFSKNIYQSEYNKDVTNYNSIDIVSGNSYTLKKSIVLNKHQTIPSNTPVAHCGYKKDLSDTWSYFACEIINPDEAITSFYIAIKNQPFIVDTIIDRNGIPILSDSIKVENNIMTYKNELKFIPLKKMSDMKKADIEKLDKKLQKYFKGRLKKYHKNYL